MTSLIIKKIEAGDIFNCKKLSNFISVIDSELQAGGISGGLLFTCNYSGIPFLTKLAIYRKQAPEIYGKTTIMRHPTDNEIDIMVELRKSIIEMGISPCILELIYYKICTKITNLSPGTDECATLIAFPRPGDKDFTSRIHTHICHYVDEINAGLAHDKIAFVVLEKCDITLFHYMERYINTPINVAIMKTIIFQIIYTLWAIRKIYPKFRHADLHSENVMLKFDIEFKYRAVEQKYLVYDVGGIKYAIPYFGIIPKIIDFGFSAIPELGLLSSSADDKQFQFARTPSDVMLLLRDIHSGISRSLEPNSGPISKILRQLVPSQLYIKHNAEYIRRHPEEIPTDEEMMSNKIFDEYRRGARGILKSQIYGEYGLSMVEKNQ
jgi:hypothetical protein